MPSHNGQARNSVVYDVLIHGHILAALLDGLVFAVVVFGIEHRVRTREEEQQRQAQLVREEQQRKAELVGRVVNEAYPRVSVLATYKHNLLWLEGHQEADAKDELGRTRSEKLRLFDQVYVVYASQPQITSLVIRIRSTFKNEQVKEDAARLEEAIDKKLWGCKKDEEIGPAVEEIKTILSRLLAGMEDEITR